MKKKIVLISGGTKGIGFEILLFFIKKNYNVVTFSRKKLSDINKKIISQLKFHKNVFFLKADIKKIKDVKRVVSFCVNKFKKIDILVSNAGIYGSAGLFEKNNYNDWIKAININFFGSVNLLREIIPIMKKKNYGRIIQISGGGATSPLPMFSSYSISKVAIVRLIETIALELKDYNILINSIAPGAFSTELTKSVLKFDKNKIGVDNYNKHLKIVKQKNNFEKLLNLVDFLTIDKNCKLSGKLISAQWDNLESLKKKQKQIVQSDLFSLRRIVGKDRDLKSLDL